MVEPRPSPALLEFEDVHKAVPLIGTRQARLVFPSIVAESAHARRASVPTGTTSVTALVATAAATTVATVTAAAESTPTGVNALPWPIVSTTLSAVYEGLTGTRGTTVGVKASTSASRASTAAPTAIIRAVAAISVTLRNLAVRAGTVATTIPSCSASTTDNQWRVIAETYKAAAAGAYIVGRAILTLLTDQNLKFCPLLQEKVPLDLSTFPARSVVMRPPLGPGDRKSIRSRGRDCPILDP